VASIPVDEKDNGEKDMTRMEPSTRVDRHKKYQHVTENKRLWEWRIRFGLLIPLFSMLCFIFLLSSQEIYAQSIEAGSGEQATISAHLAAELAAAEMPVRFLVVLRDQPDVELSLQIGAAQSRAATANTVYTTLTDHARRSQSDLRAWLDERGVDYRPYYIVNMVAVEGDAGLAAALSQRAEVARLTANPHVDQSLAVTERLPRGWRRMAIESMQATQDLPYGIVYSGAPDVWAQGYSGQGIVVAGQDTGYDWEHPALRPTYRGWSDATQSAEHIYNWYDAWDGRQRPSDCAEGAQVPCDDLGHGTHTLGTIVGRAAAGQAAVGMAPDASWIGCRNMLGGIGTPESYAACFQFFLAPHGQEDDPFTQGRPDLAPHIINNSWACPASEGCDVESLRQVVENVRAAGQFVVGSAGNGGAGGCNTVSTPIAIHDATFSIGAHSASGLIASFSSLGPVSIDGSGRPKPDLTAAGVSVWSTYPQRGYRYLSGTSMAAPHVVGAAALLWSAHPELVGAVDETEQILIKSAVPVDESQCSGTDEMVSPNAVYGFGRLDAREAVAVASRSASVSAEVYDCDGSALSGASLQLGDLYTGYIYRSLADGGGRADIPAIYVRNNSDNFDVHVRAGTARFPDLSLALAQAEDKSIVLQATTCNDPASVNVLMLGPDLEGVAGVALQLTDDETGNSYRSETDSSGRAEFVQLFAGIYRLHTEVPDGLYGDMFVTLQGGEVLDITYRAEVPSSLPPVGEPGDSSRFYLPFIAVQR
jgi:subtilisin family serine protease